MQGWVSPLLSVRFTLEGGALVLYRPDGERFVPYVELRRRMEQAEHRAQEAQEPAQRAEQRAREAEERAQQFARRLREMGMNQKNSNSPALAPTPPAGGWLRPTYPVRAMVPTARCDSRGRWGLLPSPVQRCVHPRADSGRA